MVWLAVAHADNTIATPSKAAKRARLMID
jgi:hypothetical protein